MAISNREIDLMGTVIELQKEVNGLKDSQSVWKKENKELRSLIIGLESQIKEKEVLLTEERASYARLRAYIDKCGLIYEDPLPF